MSPGAAKDEVRPVGPLRSVVQAEQLGAPANDIVLAQAAKDQVVTAAAFDIIVTIEPRVVFCGGADHKPVGRANASDGERDGAIALNGIITQLAEDHVVIRP